LLIVDDNPEFLASARALLEREGQTVVGLASNAADALQLAREVRPDVALVDVHLGPDNGFDVAQLMHELGRPQVVLVSAYTESEFGDLIADSPAAGFISKSDLSTAAITEVLSRNGGAPPAERS
jgi:DNA-binding NarL/FixJ family response regulator